MTAPPKKSRVQYLWIALGAGCMLGTMVLLVWAMGRANRMTPEPPMLASGDFYALLDAGDFEVIEIRLDGVVTGTLKRGGQARTKLSATLLEDPAYQERLVARAVMKQTRVEFGSGK